MVGQEPVPDTAVEPVAEADHALGAVADPGLGVVYAEELLGVAVGVLDGPAMGIRAGDQGRSGGGVVGDQELVGLATGGVADDGQEEGPGAGDPPPEDRSCPELTLDQLASEAEFLGVPKGERAGDLRRGGQASATEASMSSTKRPPFAHDSLRSRYHRRRGVTSWAVRWWMT